MDEQWKKLTQYQMATRQMSIFDGTQDFRKDSTQAVNDYLKDIFGGENGREQTYNK